MSSNLIDSRYYVCTCFIWSEQTSLCFVVCAAAVQYLWQFFGSWCCVIHLVLCVFFLFYFFAINIILWLPFSLFFFRVDWRFDLAVILPTLIVFLLNHAFFHILQKLQLTDWFHIKAWSSQVKQIIVQPDAWLDTGLLHICMVSRTHQTSLRPNRNSTKVWKNSSTFSFTPTGLVKQAKNIRLSGSMFQREIAFSRALRGNYTNPVCSTDLVKVSGKSDWRHKWRTFRPPWPTLPGPGRQPLGGSISLNFLLETRLQSKSFDSLDDLLGFQVQKL